MKTVYITRLDLFKNLEMVMMNNIENIEENFIDDNHHLYSKECDECEGQGILSEEKVVANEIQNLSEIDWSREEFKPYAITKAMTPDEIKKHLEDNYKETIAVDKQDDMQCPECNGEGYHDLEMYQSFVLHLSDWEKEYLESFGVRIGFSEKLGCHVLGIYDFGTGWSAFSYSKEVEDDYQLGDLETLERQTVY